MTRFFQIVAGVLIALVLGSVVSRQGKDIALLLSMAVCCMVLAAATSFLQPVIGFLERLRTLADLNADASSAVMKSVGIALTAEVAAVLCADGGNASMGKTVQLLGGAVILWLSVPVMEQLLDLIQRVLEGV
jgi:stage III sporulation protein AD